ARLAGLPCLRVDERELSDLELLGNGGLSPLRGFMGRKDYESVMKGMHLERGLPWTIPITLAVSREEAAKLKPGKEVALAGPAGGPIASLTVEEDYENEPEREAREVYRTDDRKHPGVEYLASRGPALVAGSVRLAELPPHDDFAPYRLTPSQTRKVFSDRGWRRVVGFQTRNPVHRAHEYIQKCALEIVDGILLHPLVGATKGDDVPADIRMKTYGVLFEGYYPADRVVLAVNPASMRYAGPREAIFHAIVRKNYGCTHFIVGRDHAGVGSYYGSFDAHHIFDEFRPEDLAITPLFFDHTFYCQRCQGMASKKTCPHDPSAHVTLSGTKVREMLRSGVLPPPEFTRKEIAEILIQSMREED
ncbi:MAG: sulfate adenylyltransferase, partial [Vicinamibacteria bacterium]